LRCCCWGENFLCFDWRLSSSCLKQNYSKFLKSNLSYYWGHRNKWGSITRDLWGTNKRTDGLAYIFFKEFVLLLLQRPHLCTN
jgi:hypothetical protein